MPLRAFAVEHCEAQSGMLEVGVKMTSRPSARAWRTSESSESKAPAGYEAGSLASKPAGFVRASGEGAMRRQPTST